MKYVFVCKHGEFRSPTAARIAGDLAKERGISLNTDYVGIVSELPESEKADIVRDADRVYIMEKDMRFNVEKMWRYTGEIVCLGIPDCKDLSEAEIKKTIEDKVKF